MANPIQFTDNVIATFQDRDAVALHVVTKYDDSPTGAAFTTSDLATLDELEVVNGPLAAMMALFVSKVEAAHNMTTCSQCGSTGETVTPENYGRAYALLLCPACQDAPVPASAFANIN